MGIPRRGLQALYAAAGVLAAVLLFVVGGGLMLRALERQLIYFPTRVDRALATPNVEGASSVEEIWLETDDGLRIHGLHVKRAGAVAELLVFHGNAGNLYDRLDNVAYLVQTGFNVLILDYRGYGKSDGTPSEEGLYADGLAAYRHLTERLEVSPERVVLFGRSLGSTVAIELGAQFAVGAIIIESGFTSAQDLARVHYPWVPGFIISSMTHEFDSLSKAPRLRAPTLYIHGDADRIVPQRQGRRLYEASPEPKEWYEIKGAGHNDTWYVAGEVYFERLADFTNRYGPSSSDDG